MVNSSAKSLRILVTGASSGIGRSAAARFAGYGHAVVGTSRRPVDSALPDWPEGVVRRQYDAAEPDAGRKLIGASVEALGGLDLVVANAGIGSFGRMAESRREDMERQFAVNCFGVLELGQAALPHLRESCGRFIAVGSIASTIALPGQGLYSASKAALRIALDAWCQELKASGEEGLRILLVEPGDTATGFDERRWVMGTSGPDPVVDQARVAAARHEHGGLDPGRVAGEIHRLATAPSPRFRTVVASPVERFALALHRLGLRKWVDKPLRRRFFHS